MTALQERTDRYLADYAAELKAQIAEIAGDEMAERIIALPKIKSGLRQSAQAAAFYPQR